MFYHLAIVFLYETTCLEWQAICVYYQFIIRRFVIRNSCLQCILNNLQQHASASKHRILFFLQPIFKKSVQFENLKRPKWSPLVTHFGQSNTELNFFFFSTVGVKKIIIHNTFGLFFLFLDVCHSLAHVKTLSLTERVIVSNRRWFSTLPRMWRLALPRVAISNASATRRAVISEACYQRIRRRSLVRAGERSWRQQRWRGGDWRARSGGGVAARYSGAATAFGGFRRGCLLGLLWQSVLAVASERARLSTD